MALDDLAELIAPKQVVICEGSPLGSSGRNIQMDAVCYNTIFTREFPDTRFLSGGDTKSVETDRIALMEAIKALVEGTKLVRLVDRDEKSDEEVQEFMKRGIRVLRRRHLECYLFDDEVIIELCKRNGGENDVDDIVNEKNNIILKIHNEQNKPIDDVKSSSGFIYNMLKQRLRLNKSGSNAKEFIRSVLAPIITSDMNVYQELRKDIFDI